MKEDGIKIIKKNLFTGTLFDMGIKQTNSVFDVVKALHPFKSSYPGYYGYGPLAFNGDYEVPYRTDGVDE